MKNSKISFVISFAFLMSFAVKAQDCSYYSLSEGMVTAYQNLDAKGKVTSTTRSTCLNVSKVGAATVYKMKSEFADVKNKNQSTKEYGMKCEDGKFYVDMQNLVDPKSMEAFKGRKLVSKIPIWSILRAYHLVRHCQMPVLLLRPPQEALIC